MTVVASTIVPPGTVVDTTQHPQWTPVRVTAHLADPIIELDSNPLHLDGILSYAGWLRHLDAHGHGHLPPLGPDECKDFTLPLATWTRPASVPNPHYLALADTDRQVWGWACSAGLYTPEAYTTVNLRRRPAVEQMVRYTSDKSHHLSTGPLKARDVPYGATLVARVTWWALAEPEQLTTMLNRVPGLGRKTCLGNGHVHQWDVAEDPDAVDRWTWRHLPHPDGQPAGIRAPYHHLSRRMPCTMLGAPPWA